ncbi:MAG: alpha-2-macroglobulin [Opitutales bacterium]
MLEFTKVSFRLLPLILLTFFVGPPLAAQPVVAPPPDYAEQKERAEARYAEGSFALARQIYESLLTMDLPEAELHWVAYRIHDTTWREAAAANSVDLTPVVQARTSLDTLAQTVEKAAGTGNRPPEIWALIRQSQGESFFIAKGRSIYVWDFNQGWSFLRQTLDWYASSTDIELARQRYLDIVFESAQRGTRNYYGPAYRWYWMVPVDVLENAVRITEGLDERAQAQYFFGVALSLQGNQRQRLRAGEVFASALESAEGTDWLDDVLFEFARWAEQNGSNRYDTRSGNLILESDFERALRLYRRIIDAYRRGESRYYELAENRVQAITEASLEISANNAFLPEGLVSLQLNWRNVSDAVVSFYPVDLPAETLHSDESLPDQIDLNGRDPVLVLTENVTTDRAHVQGRRTLRLNAQLPAGAFIAEAVSGEARGRCLVLVSDVALLVQTHGNQLACYLADARTGAPVARAPVRATFQRRVDGRRVFRSVSGVTDDQGLLSLNFPEEDGWYTQIVTAGTPQRQTFTTRTGRARTFGKNERIYAFTDRPAYRPGETVQWKIVLRDWDATAGWVLSKKSDWHYRILNPQGEVVSEGPVTPGEFGTMTGELELSDAMKLGSYTIALSDPPTTPGRYRDSTRQATLFRLEEYKLPEYKVNVDVGTQPDGTPAVYRLGDSVEVEVSAEYYFGGGVPDAEVEIIVTQNFYAHWWQPRREFAWYYDDSAFRGGGGGQQTLRQTVRTDADGKARLTFDTPASSRSDLRFSVEARVTDASRRVVIGQAEVKVTRQPYYVFLKPEQNLYQPGERAEIAVRSENPNSQGLPVSGSLILTRQQWTQIWLGPNNRTIDGRELDRLVREGRADKADYVRVRQSYVSEPVERRTFGTDNNGDAIAAFVIPREGFYKIEWLSFDDRGVPVKAEAGFYAADDASQEIGYKGGLQLVIDKEAARVGDGFPVMITTPVPNRHVLLSIHADGVFEQQLVKVEGTVELVRLKVSEAWTPNVFLSAALFNDLNFLEDSKEVIVPPVEQFLNVAIEPERKFLQPGEATRFTVTLTDSVGQPVLGEFALSVFDESVLYIQSDLAGDPRQAFYGDKRSSGVSRRASLYDLRFSRETWEDYLRQQGLIAADYDAQLQNAREAELFSPFRSISRGTEEARDGSGLSFKSLANEPFGGVAGNLSVVEMPEVFEEVSLLSAPPAPPRSQAAKADAAPTTPEIIVRSDFRSTALWSPNVTTDANGQANVSVELPQNVTTWQALVRALSLTTKVGQGSGAVVTRLPLIARLQAPRFFTVGDEPLLSGVFNNTTRSDFSITPSLEISGDALTLQPREADSDSVRIPAGKDLRVDWQAQAATPGEVSVKLTGVGDRYADAMEQSFEIFEHGIEKFEALSGRLDSEAVELTLNLPRHKPDSRALTVHVTPSLAVTMLDAMPYLVRYHYGCVEQTMSRFLPAVCVAKTLGDLGVEPDAIADKVFGGIEPDAVPTVMNLDRFAGIEKLDAVTRQGIERLKDFQHSDGGWGWWKTDDSDLFMTAYVVWGLTLAQQAALDLPPKMLERGRDFLDFKLVEAELRPDLQAWMLHALAEAKRSARDSRPSPNEATAFAELWENRDRLNSYTRALLALSAHAFNFSDEAAILARNLRNGVQRADNPEQSILIRDAQGNRNPAVIPTAHWGAGGVYWRWSDGGVESTAFALRALLAIEPEADLIVPTMNWLVKNRRGAQWSNTRDTAITLLALNDYLRSSGELESDFSYGIDVNGKRVGEAQLTPHTVLQAPSQFEVDPEVLREGANTITLSRTGGTGALYFSARADYFTLEEPITAAGNEIFLHRQYYRIQPVPTLLNGFREELVPLNDGETVQSGDRIECVLLVEGKNDYEYLIFEDIKPAGLEAVAIRSGGANIRAREVREEVVQAFLEGTTTPDGKAAYWRQDDRYSGASRSVYQELRDRHIASFISKLPEGYWEIRYSLRAEVPGMFHGLPALGHAMYVPEIRANSREMRLTIVGDNSSAP